MSQMCSCSSLGTAASCRPTRAFKRSTVRSVRTHALRRAHASIVCASRAVIEEQEQGDREGGTGVLDRPDFGTGTTTLEPSTESNFGATDIGGSKELGGGDYRVLLLDDDRHTEELVVNVITTVVATVDEQKARNCFATSKQLGQALVTSCLKEHAELYTDQMRRKGCKASMEPDTTTL